KRWIFLLAIVACVVAGVFLYFYRTRSGMSAPSSTGDTATQAIDAKVAANATPFWDDPAAELERLRTPVPAPPEAAGSSKAETTVDEFSGQVIDAETKRPLAGAVVSQYLFDRGDYSLNAPGMRDIEGKLSDADGRFYFAPINIEPNRTLVWTAEKEGYERRAVLFPGGEGQGDRLRTTLLLGKEGTIAGKVVD